MESIVSLCESIGEIEIGRNILDLWNAISGIFIWAPGTLMTGILKYILCTLWGDGWGNPAGPLPCWGRITEAMESIQRDMGKTQNRTELGGGRSKRGGRRVPQVSQYYKEKIKPIVEKMRKEMKKKYGETYEVAKKDARATFKELFKPLKKGETHLDQIINIASTLAGNAITQGFKKS